MFKRIGPSFYLIGLLLLLLLAHSWHGPDIWYHLFWGRDLIENGNWIPDPPVVLAQPIPANPYWIFQSLLHFTHSLGGIYLISLFFAALWVAIGWLWLRISELYKNPLGAWVFAAFVICMQLRFEHRPEILSYFFITLFIFLGLGLRNAGKWSLKVLTTLALLQVIWVGCHGYFVFGPFLVGSMAWRCGAKLTKAVFLTMGFLLLTLISPFGYRVWESVYLYAQLGRGTAEFNSELMSPPFLLSFFPNAVFWLIWAAVFALTLFSLKKRDWVSAVLAMAALVLSAQAIRNMPLLFLLTPLLWRHLPAGKRWLNYARPAGAALAAVVLFLSGSVVSGHYHRWVNSLSTFGVKLEWASYPIGAVEFLKSSGFKGTLFCDSYDGGYIEYHLDGVRIAGDSYFADSEVTKRFFASIRSPEHLAHLDSQVRFDGFLINIENLDIMDMLLSQPSLVVVYADSHRAVFLKKERAPAGAVGDLSVFRYYHGEDLRHWAYAFGVVSWTGLAAKRQNVSLIKKILTDIGGAQHVPEDLFRIALKFAIDRRDDEVVRMLAAIKDRTL